ncbi:virulence RhuM family protein [Patescibacteria group bacterium]|nr:virulence RhuM family protein [Patescibacteria group bacterium]MBU1721362.1 virulence RhuM family protein [Patescibacteria group bacterium]
MKNEIIIYQPEDTSIRIDVKLKDDTVWLNRFQISELFGRDIKTIGKHINNALKEELKDLSVVAKFATTASDGKIYQVEHYDLDLILSIGYRVKSKQGIQFRIWANKILKDYLLKGYAINNRVSHLEDHVYQLSKKVNEIDLQLNISLPSNQGVFYDGQIFDAYAFVNDLLRTAKKEVVLIDNYIDDSVLTLFSKYPKLKFVIITKKVSKQLQLDIDKYNEQYNNVSIEVSSKYHDRFLILDKNTYHIGASLKDLGKKIFAFSKMEINILK